MCTSSIQQMKMLCVSGDKNGKPDSLKSGEETEKEVYHERQSRELCALHALNNLFQQRRTFTKKDLDEICLSLSPDSYVNPHRSFIGLGNYDVNVIMAALHSKKYQTVWFDKRKSIESLDLSNVYGFILNVPTDLKWGILHLPIHRKHWITVREINNVFYNLDSKLDAPEKIGTDTDVRKYLKEQIESKDKELLVIISLDMPVELLWQNEKKEVCNGES